MTFELVPFKMAAPIEPSLMIFSQDHWPRWLMEKVAFDLGVRLECSLGR